ncbi:MAG: hypothetical protein M1330_04125 [Armatimonadetes bacterium]|nr:hypothetical protein [Armatimonadota bacterium]
MGGKGFIITPSPQPPSYLDPNSGDSYDATVYGYIDNPILGVTPRFALHCSRQADLPLARNAAKLLLLLWSEVHSRLGLDHNLNNRVVQVWLTRDGPAGGEESDGQVFLTGILHPRIPAEWIREIAHEYGHLMLTSPSGYSKPESWANGVLGERLFIHWLEQDMENKRINADSLPFGDLKDLQYYCTRQVDPLIEQAEVEGISERVLAGHNAAAFNAFTELILVIDQQFGSHIIKSMQYDMPALDGRPLTAYDYERSLFTVLSAHSRFGINLPPDLSRMYLLLPKGKWAASGQPAVIDLSYKAATLQLKHDNVLTTPFDGWYILKWRKSSNRGRLTLRKL